METHNEDYSCVTANLNAPTMFGSKDLSKDLLAKRLRDLIPHANDDDRCTLCKAADALESGNTNSSWPFLIIFLFLVFGWGGDSISSEFIKSLAKVLEVNHESSEMHTNE